MQSISGLDWKSASLRKLLHLGSRGSGVFIEFREFEFRKEFLKGRKVSAKVINRKPSSVVVPGEAVVAEFPFDSLQDPFIDFRTDGRDDDDDALGWIGRG